MTVPSDGQILSRRDAARQALASVRASGCEPSADAEAIVERWMAGEMTIAEMEREVLALHGIEG